MLSGLRGHSFDEACGRWGGGGKEHAVEGPDISRSALDFKGIVLAGNTGDEGIEVNLRAGFLCQSLVEFGVTALEGAKDGALGGAAARLDLLNRSRQRHRAILRHSVQGRRQVRKRGAQAQVIGNAGVHATEQRRDHVVHHVIAVLLTHELTDGHITANLPLERLLVGDALVGCSREEVLRLGRNTHDPALRQEVQLAASIDAGAQLSIGLHDGLMQTQLGKEIDGVLAAADKGFRAHVGRPAVKRHCVQFSTDALGRLENVYLVGAQLPGGGQSC